MLELSLILCCCYYPATQRIILMKMYDVENFRLSCLFYSIIFCFEARLFGGFSLLLFFLFTSICFSIIFKWYRASERWMEWEGNFLILKMLLQNPIFTLTSDDSLFCLSNLFMRDVVSDSRLIGKSFLVDFHFISSSSFRLCCAHY